MYTTKKISFLRKIELKGSRSKSDVLYWLFKADVTNVWDGYELREGQASILFSFDELKRQPMPVLIRILILWHHARGK